MSAERLDFDSPDINQVLGSSLVLATDPDHNWPPAFVELWEAFVRGGKVRGSLPWRQMVLAASAGGFPFALWLIFGGQ